MFADTLLTGIVS